MKKEIIKLNMQEVAAILNWDNVCDWDEFYDEDGDEISGIWNDFEIIEENTNYFSLDDSYENVSVIVKRFSDGKFFKGTYTCYYDFTEYDDLELIEVIPVEKTIIVYE